MNIAIVDDSAADRAQLRHEIECFSAANHLAVQLTEYESGETFLAHAPLLTIDAVFLDIYMDGLDGVAVAQHLRERAAECRVIFLTSTAAFAVQSYSVEAFFYILKPFSAADIASVLGRLDRSLQKSSHYIKVKEGRNWSKVPVSDILYADYSNHYVRIHTESSIISTYMKFPEIEENLLRYDEFMNCYRCIVINMSKIQKIDGAFFLLRNGEYIPINRKRAKEVKTHYTDYVFGLIEEGGTPNAR